MSTFANDAATLCRFLEESGQTIAVAESLTIGHVQALIGSVSGASKVFSGGITAYTLEQKVRHLGVDRSHAQTVNSVSERVAVEMARGVRRLFGASVGLATTGYAEPAPGEQVEAPFAYVAANVHGRAWAWCIEGGGGGRTDVQVRVAVRAVQNLVAAMRALASEGDLSGDLGRLRQAVLEIVGGS
jgi:nicotinamide-nucleotide amidase